MIIEGIIVIPKMKQPRKISNSFAILRLAGVFIVCMYPYQDEIIKLLIRLKHWDGNSITV
jgi:hypothetical protein